MSVIALTSNGLNGDFEILFDDETVGTNAVAGMRMVRRASGATDTVHTTQALYSAIADKTDEFIAMGFKNPMEPITPNAFRVVNKYFLPRSSTEFLKEGAIDMDLSIAAGDGVFRKVYAAVPTQAPVAADVGRQVTEATSGDTGTLIDFETEPDGTLVIWIRPDTSGDTFLLSTALTTTGDGGAMDVVGSGVATSGNTRFSAIQAIGAVPTATDVYIYQDRFKMTDWTGAFQWWATDTGVSLGIISILIRVQNADVSIADGDVEVFSRRYTSLYDNFRLNVAGGGFSALPLASAPDINNTTGYQTFTGSAGVSDFDVGNGIYVGATYATATKRGVITAVGGTVGAPIIEYYLVGDLTDFANLDAVKEFDFVTGLDGDGTCTAAAPSVNLGGPTDPAAGEGGTVTITLGETQVDHDGDGNDEDYSIEIDAQTLVPIAKVYERIKYVCRRGGDDTDLFGVAVNMLGEAYRGLDGQFEYDASTGTLGPGEDLLTTTGGSTWTARLASQQTVPTPDYIMVMDQQTSLDSIQNDDVVEDEGGTEDVTIHGAGTLGIVNFTSPKSSPFGTFTGSQIFGARGVVYINPAAADNQAYILTDDGGTLRTPPNTVSFVVNNSAAFDRVYVSRDTGTAGVINKDQFGGMTVTAASATSITVAGSIDSEVPQAAWVRVIAVDEQQEHHYKYASRTVGASGVFTLHPVTPGTASAGTSSTQLSDAAADFVTDGVEPGMLIQDTTNTGTYEVVSVTDLNTLVIQHLYGADLFASLDTYTINETIQAYDTSDNLHDLIIDEEATGDPTSNSFVKTPASDFGVVVNVRQGKVILPFTQNVTVDDGGGSATVVRTTDTIAT